MCGFAGFIDHGRNVGEETLLKLAKNMAGVLAHRGPDDEGRWADSGAGYAVAHRRLSILDLSPEGHQPMVSGNGRYVIAYNGEVYNFTDIRRQLEAKGVAFHGHSDTEVVLEAWSAWGKGAVPRFIGMFAFAIWDRETRSLTLVRDRLGIKPLYWGKFGDLLLFGSELKSLRAHPGWTPTLDRGALMSFLSYLYVPGPGCIYQGIHKLAPGTLMEVSQDREPRVTRYWSLEKVVVDGAANPLDLPDAEAVDRLENILGDAVEKRLIADVPLGGFLSGGVDSSTVAALMQSRASSPVKTFSIGFDEEGYDEAQYAAKVAAHLGTDHTELYVDAEQALDVIPGLADMYDEPFADCSQIPTYLVSKLTRRHVTVSLSGDGGDELFAGYNRYILAEGAWRHFARLPKLVKLALSAGIRAVPPGGWDLVFAALPERLRIPRAGDNLHKFAGLAGAQGVNGLYKSVITHWDKPAQMVKGAGGPPNMLWDSDRASRMEGAYQRMRFLDTACFIPDDILTKVDRASMAVSLEARVPILDHRVVEFAFGLPSRQLIRDGQSKWLLRQVLYRHVPRKLIERPKMGFSVPLDSWLRGPLRDWAEALLDEHRLQAEGVFDPALIRERWRQHQSGRRNWQYHLWAVLMFQCWFERWKPSLA